MNAKLILNAKDSVGESLLWDDRRERLVWIDIIGRRVHAFAPATGQSHLWQLPFRPTSLALRADGQAIICSERHICAWDWQGTPRPIVEVEPDLPGNRLNEGAVGPDGALWLGSMSQNIAEDDSPQEIAAPTGRLYRYTIDGRLAQVSNDRFGITNTLVWPQSDQLIVGDTLQNALYRYPIGVDGQLGARVVYAQGLDRGLPDGSCTDAAGRVWNARVVGGRAVACLDRSGDLIAYHEVPCLWPTSCAFGGANFDSLFVTSARFTQSDPADHEGGLFVLEGVGQGLPANRFGQPAKP